MQRNQPKFFKSLRSPYCLPFTVYNSYTASNKSFKNAALIPFDFHTLMQYWCWNIVLKKFYLPCQSACSFPLGLLVDYLVKSNGHLPHLPHLVLVEGFIHRPSFCLYTSDKCQAPPAPPYVPEEILFKVAASKKKNFSNHVKWILHHMLAGKHGVHSKSSSFQKVQ